MLPARYLHSDIDWADWRGQTLMPILQDIGFDGQLEVFDARHTTPESLLRVMRVIWIRVRAARP